MPSVLGLKTSSKNQSFKTLPINLFQNSTEVQECYSIGLHYNFYYGGCFKFIEFKLKFVNIDLGNTSNQSLYHKMTRTV